MKDSNFCLVVSNDCKRQCSWWLPYIASRLESYNQTKDNYGTMWDKRFKQVDNWSMHVHIRYCHEPRMCCHEYFEPSLRWNQLMRWLSVLMSTVLHF